MVNELDKAAALAEEYRIMAAYISSAKTYTKLSMAALILSITFFEKVLAHTGRVPVDVPLLLAWLGWLVAALGGSFYEYLAVRYLEWRGEEWGLLERFGHVRTFQQLARHPWKAYAVMLVSFYIGSIAFAVVGTIRLLK